MSEVTLADLLVEGRPSRGTVTRRASVDDVRTVVETLGAGTLYVVANPTPTTDEWGEPMQDYSIVQRGLTDTTATTLKPGRYLVWRIEEVDSEQ